MHPVAEIAVQVTGLPEHGGVAGGAAPEGVRPGVDGPGVGLHLRDADRDGAVTGGPGQRTAEQQRRELQDGATEPVAGGACETGQVHEGIVPRPDPGAGPPSHLTERLLAAGRRDH